VGSRKLNHFLSLSSEALVREISRLGHSLSRNETWASRYVKITLFDLSENPSRLNQSHGLLDAIVVHDTLPSRSIARSHFILCLADAEPSSNATFERTKAISFSAEPIPFARSTRREHRHVGAFFNSAQDEYDTLLPFICGGLNCGQREFHMLPSQHRANHLQRLRDVDVDVERTQESRQLEVALPERPICAGGSSTRTPC
jgi:hypothetical protein